MSYKLPDIGKRDIIMKVLAKNCFKRYFADDITRIHFKKGKKTLQFPMDQCYSRAISEYIIDSSGISRKKFLKDYYFELS